MRFKRKCQTPEIAQDRIAHERIVAEKEEEIRQLRAQLARLENNNNS